MFYLFVSEGVLLVSMRFCVSVGEGLDIVFLSSYVFFSFAFPLSVEASVCLPVSLFLRPWVRGAADTGAGQRL